MMALREAIALAKTFPLKVLETGSNERAAATAAFSTTSSLESSASVILYHTAYVSAGKVQWNPAATYRAWMAASSPISEGMVPSSRSESARELGESPASASGLVTFASSYGGVSTRRKKRGSRALPPPWPRR